MRKGFEQESAATRKPTLLLTAAVPAGKSYIDGGYDIPLIMPYVYLLSKVQLHKLNFLTFLHNQVFYERQI